MDSFWSFRRSIRAANREENVIEHQQMSRDSESRDSDGFIYRSSSSSSSSDDNAVQVERRDRNREMIMNYIRRARGEIENDIFEPRRTFRASSMLYGAVYYKIKKIAIEIIESNKIDLDLEINESQHDVVRKFIIYLFKLADKSTTCINSLKSFLSIIKMLPNRFKLIKMLQNLKGRKLEEGGLILCMLRLNELRYQLSESSFSRKHAEKILPDLLEMFKIFDPSLYKQIVNHIKQYCDIDKYEIFPTIEEAKSKIKQKIKEFKRLDCHNSDHLYYV